MIGRMIQPLDLTSANAYASIAQMEVWREGQKRVAYQVVNAHGFG